MRMDWWKYSSTFRSTRMNLIIIAELYKQSFITIPHQPTSGFDAAIEDTIFVPEKFAELIVKECIECIQLTTARDPQYTVQYRQSVGHIHRIREHFGVE